MYKKQIVQNKFMFNKEYRNIFIYLRKSNMEGNRNKYISSLNNTDWDKGIGLTLHRLLLISGVRTVCDYSGIH
jgi:hypothetical protein